MGGTDLFPGLREGIYRPRIVIDVKGLPGMTDIVFEEDGGLAVGAAVTMNALVADPFVQKHYPLLAQAAGTVASYQLRNRATIGGNLCNASPCADTSPATVVLEAQFALAGPIGVRMVPAGQFFTGPGQTVRQPDEFLTSIHLPLPANGAARYLKLGRCKSGDLSLVGVAVCALSNGTVPSHEYRIGLGSVAPTPVRATAAEALLADNPPGEETFARAAAEAMAAARPITDVRGSAEYQRAMVRTLTLRALRDVWAQIQEGS
jgi:carbon-monoxide dehydrogenase medium subunit